ncbi:hypothetical protein SNQ56_002092 [Cronobacter muytjensii]|nr:hypothetical protein [Cronobacter muytjensii]
MSEISKVIASEIADFFAGFGGPGEPDIQSGEAPRLLTERVLSVLALRERAEPVIPGGLHPATADLVLRFATALAEKLHKAEQKYGYSDNWQQRDWYHDCLQSLWEHIKKGDPRDVAAYCAFMWHHGWKTEPAPPAPVALRERAEPVQVPDSPPEHLLPHSKSVDAAYRRGGIIEGWRLCRAALANYAAPPAPVVPDVETATCKYCGGSGYYRVQQSYNRAPCPCRHCTELASTGKEW